MCCDEAWALYTGSLVQQGADHGAEGLMLFTLADKRCKDFGMYERRTPNAQPARAERGVAAVNVHVLVLFTQGNWDLKAGE